MEPVRRAPRGRRRRWPGPGAAGRARRRLDRRHGRRAGRPRPAPTTCSRSSTGSPASAGLAGQAVGLPAARRRHAGDADVLAFVDADVTLEPHALTATVALLRAAGLDLVCPYPRQEAADPGRAAACSRCCSGRGSSTLPLAARRAVPPARRTAVANGQLLVVDAGAYRRARRPRRGARRGARGPRPAPRAQAQPAGAAPWSTAPTSPPAGCTTAGPTCGRGTPSRCGRRSARPPAPRRARACCCWPTCVPAVAALRRLAHRSRSGTPPSVASRVLVARRTGGRAWPDALAHPVSVAALGRAHRRLLAWRTGAATAAVEGPRRVEVRPREPRRRRRRRGRRARRGGPAGRARPRRHGARAGRRGRRQARHRGPRRLRLRHRALAADDAARAGGAVRGDRRPAGRRARACSGSTWPAATGSPTAPCSTCPATRPRCRPRSTPPSGPAAARSGRR